MRVLVAVLVAATSSCAPVIALGGERGRANLSVDADDDGTVFIERRPSRGANRGREPSVLVMLHGFGGSKDHWTRFCAQMPSDVWLIAPDLPGFGESPKDSGLSYDLRAQSARLERFLALHNITKFHLVGNSMGGELAALYASTHPRQVQSLVLFDPSGIPSPTPSAMDKLTAKGLHPLIVKSAADFDQLLRLSFATPPDIPDSIKEYFAERSAQNAAMEEKIKADISAKPAHVADVIATVKAPTLVVWGGEDQILDPSVIPLWRAAVPGHLVAVMRETGHGPQIERPAEAAALVLVWWHQHGFELPVPAPASE